MGANGKQVATVDARPSSIHQPDVRVNLVPAVIALVPEQRDVIVSARPSLPKQLGSADVVRVEIRDREGTVVWASDVLAGQLQQRLADPGGVVSLVVPARSLPVGAYLVNFCRATVPFFRATFEVVEAG